MSQARIELSAPLIEYLLRTAGKGAQTVQEALAHIDNRAGAEEERALKSFEAELRDIAAIRVSIAYHPPILALVMGYYSTLADALLIDLTGADYSLESFMSDSVDFTTPADAIPKEAYTYNLTFRPKLFYIEGKVYAAPGRDLIVERLPPLDLSPSPDLRPIRGTERRYRLKQMGFTYTSEYRALLTTGERGIIQTIREKILSGQCQEEIK